MNPKPQHFKKGNKMALGHGCGRPQMYTVPVLEEMAADLMEWAKKEDSIVFREWLALKGIGPSTCKDLKERSHVFAKAIEDAKYLIGCRRERLALHGELNDSIVRTSMGIYDPEMKEWIMEQKKADNDRPSTIIVKGIRGRMSDDKAK